MLLMFTLPYYCNRPYWRCYFPNTQAIIYVVDSSDTDRLVIAKEEFHAILEVYLYLTPNLFPFFFGLLIENGRLRGLFLLKGNLVIFMHSLLSKIVIITLG